ncbi:hypothetical protein EDB85DRAFT_1050856 [Lactarius pseudohatsudake]|nr:hypothetical protein EDB85DRAFT_1050856 [Lactarius pseudohatsudake]
MRSKSCECAKYPSAFVLLATSESEKGDQEPPPKRKAGGNCDPTLKRTSAFFERRRPFAVAYTLKRRSDVASSVIASLSSVPARDRVLPLLPSLELHVGVAMTHVHHMICHTSASERRAQALVLSNADARASGHQHRSRGCLVPNRTFDALAPQRYRGWRRHLVDWRGGGRSPVIWLENRSEAMPRIFFACFTNELRISGEETDNTEGQQKRLLASF